MSKTWNSLLTKLILSFVLLIVVIAGGTFLYTFGQTKTALLEITKDDVRQMIGIASTQVSAEEMTRIAQLKEGQDSSPEYLALVEKFQNMRALSPNIVNFYVMRVEGDKVVFFLDDSPDEDAAKIGQLYEEPETRLYDGVSGPTVSDDVYTDEWGTYLSGYAPLKDANGQTAFVIGADMLAMQVIERQNFIGNTIYFIMGLGVLLAAIIVGIFARTIIRDIRKLNAAAEAISMGDTNVTVGVRRKDEIGELAESFSRMVASLKIMMAVDEFPDEGIDIPDVE